MCTHREALVVERIFIAWIKWNYENLANFFIWKDEYFGFFFFYVSDEESF